MAVVKERLQVVLIHDRADMEIASKNDADSVTLVANIPVNSMRHAG